MLPVFIMFYVVVSVCAVAVMRSPTDNIMFIPTIVVLVLGVVANTGLAVSWVKSRKADTVLGDEEYCSYGERKCE